MSRFLIASGFFYLNDADQLQFNYAQTILFTACVALGWWLAS